MQTPIKQLYKESYKSFGIAAFNVFNAEQIFAVFKGISKSHLPAIIQITPTALKYLPHRIFSNCIKACEELYPEVRFSVHLDHGSAEYCHIAIASGFFDSIMIDASHETFKKNINTTKKIVQLAHNRNIAVEAELGRLSGVEDNTTVSHKDAFYTDPEQAIEFIQKTACDSLAVAVGTKHGAYKLGPGQGLQLHILKKINQLLPGYPLVLHGASEVPPQEIARINNAGGQLKTSSHGIPLEELRQAIKLGVCKINIATDIRLIWTRTHREFFQKNPDQFDPVVPGKTFMEAIENFVYEKIKSLS